MRKKTTVKKVIDTELNLFYEQSVLKYREDNLVNENEEFADVLKEYRDGLLLFDLMENEIWNKASKDSIGLENYYNANKSRYVWEDRVDVVMASVSTEAIANNIKALLQEGKTEDEIKKNINTQKQNVIFTNGVFEISNPKLPSDLDTTEGVSKVYNHNGGFHVLNILNVLPSSNKTLTQAKGKVVSDYQSQIEKLWIKDLKSRFKVEVNNKVLQKLKSKINK